jgi:hypothetical protein
MTEYKNFIQDFPGRCRDILDLTGKQATFRGREVTLALMVASAGLVVPFERLRPETREGYHPSGDNEKYADAAEQLKSLLDKPFLSSVLCNGTNSTWFAGKLKSVEGDPDSWEGLRKRKPLSTDQKVRTSLTVIRNSLAHGNTFTFRNPIEAIIFVKKNTNYEGIIRDFSFLYVEPQEFRKFLENWFDFLNTFCIPQQATIEVLRDAA